MLLALLAGLAGPAGADEARADAAAATLRFESSRTSDADGAVDTERSVAAEVVDADARRWRWQASDLAGHRIGTQGRGTAFGVQVELPEDSRTPPALLHWVRSAGVVAYSRTSALDWRLAVGSEPVTFTISRDAIVWWLGLHARQRLLQAHPLFVGVQWGLDCARLSVSDGNRVQDCSLQADPQWASWSEGRIQLYAMAHRRVAARHSLYYWSPADAESHAGLGLRLGLQWGNWKVDVEGQALRPLNAEIDTSWRCLARLRWQPTSALRIGLSLDNGRSKASIGDLAATAKALNAMLLAGVGKAG